MTQEELRAIVAEELEGRPVRAPADTDAALDLYYRDLRFLPAQEVRLGIRSFYASPVCERCGTRSQRWPHAEEVRAQIPQMVIDRIAAASAAEQACTLCGGDGWRLVRRRDGEGVERCECVAKKEAKPSRPARKLPPAPPEREWYV